ncbi:MAG: helix-turn-helix domain-containing protein [Propionibacteriaceae bacterium]|nr:helix-turn-helix domain-containing protein [Propionibacteriaceae bacterium]
MSATLTPETVLPPDDPYELESLNALLPKLSPHIRKGLTAFIDALSKGEAVRIEPVSTMLTTSQAAEILNVSRMTLVKLLDDGRIPYQQPSVHRQVCLADVLAYKDERSRKRANYLEDSMQQADEDDLLLLDIDTYTTSLKHAKRQSLS